MLEKNHNRLRQIPKVDKILEAPLWAELIKAHGHAFAVEECRKAIGRAKQLILSKENGDVGLIVETELQSSYLLARLRPLQPVINATGIILHTNLGRAPFSHELVEEIAKNLIGACNVEIDLYSGERGVRGCFVREMLARICKAEDGLVVNNNAAALLLALSAIAAGKEVIVSRGELIQIGGGFRIPDIIQQGGARLKEVGTSNITTLDDYRRALSPQTGAILKVHLSNFTQRGFVSRPSTQELALLKSETIPLIEDLGSGNLIPRFQKRVLTDPPPSQVLASGADLICFSGDKLLGGVQAGLIAGRKNLIAQLAALPLMRAIRPDKVVYSILQFVLSAYEKGEPEQLAPWKQLKQSREEIAKRIDRFCETYGVSRKLHPIVETWGEFGAGSLPGEKIESAALLVTEKDVDRASRTFRTASPSVIGIVHQGQFLLDFLTVSVEEEPRLAEVVLSCIEE